MKFPADSKSTLCIYTEGDFLEEKAVLDEQEQKKSPATCCSELRRQLLAAKAALREQEGRCRQLLVAVGSRLRRAEALRVQQLGTVMAALLGLEARLRQEQANIRQQLARRDAVIRSQALEIARLRRAARKELRGTLYKDYQHNPVLECVNQILLRDRDDDDPTPTSASTPTCASIKEEDEEEEQPAPPPPPPPPPPPKLSPPTKAQHLEEKACLLMASRRLTLVRNVELEEVDRKEEPKRTFQKANRVPPALPPKPPQLGSLLLARSKKNYIKNHGNLSPHPLQIRQRQAEPEPDKPRQRQILSNGSLKVAQHLKRADVKVGCSVSKLITGSDSGSIVTELTQEVPHSNDKYYDGELRSNFEEFRLDDVDMERPAGDGAESRVSAPTPTPTPAPTPAPVHAPPQAYESFLEATGLSQKSIVTPSRLLSNHRSVLKPKDVKHRHRVLREAAVVRYWVEPFL